ncbi:MAG: 4-hydroxy-3-methylbut-2-enyl diphosphate reductase [Ruminococcaceae bacterium]|nr:4-hydroxy-3-methylbut-2-enyl diphosphate reductase [Oscillospiraceae bacterium]
MQNKITVADHAGFCFGVKRATGMLEERIASAREGERIFTLGNLIHNEGYMARLAELGVLATDESALERLAAEANENAPVTVFVRAHGMTKETEKMLADLSSKHHNFTYVDCTCPYVSRIHGIAEKNSSDENVFILIGKKTHPECVGIVSRFDGETLVLADEGELDDFLSDGGVVKITKKTPVVAAQTTTNMGEWHKCQKKIKKLCTNSIIFDTICKVTQERQTEAAELSAKADAMIVIGGRSSSNTRKLYDICRENCEKTFMIGSADELDPTALSDCTEIGIVAGASTPGYIIQEVFKTMSENMNKVENFEEMLEASLKTLNTGDIVCAYVTQVTDAELQVDVGAKVTGIIKAEQISDDPLFKLTENFKIGDEVEAFVIRVSDVEGVAELSKKRVDSDRNSKRVMAAAETGEILEGKVITVTKGGVIVSVSGVQVFVPASQTGIAKDGDLSVLAKQDVKLRVIEVKAAERGRGKKIIGSIKSVQNEERREKEAAFWAELEEGKQYTGRVKSMTSYGAFVDLGAGVDGMVHATELSWKHIKSPAEVVSIGDEITVFVKSFDAEKRRISLGYKTDEMNPWYIFTGKYAVGDVASVKIVNMMPFGAFAEIVDGVDGLIHISQIANKRIAQPAEVLEIGQVVDAKIIDIDNEKQKVSLSIRALIEEAPVEEAAEEVAEEAVETVEE